MRIGKTRWNVAVRFEKRDAWVGVFWDVDMDIYDRPWLSIYVCLLPFLPIVFGRAPTTWYVDRPVKEGTHGG